MRQLKRINWGKDHYPLIDLVSFSLSAIPQEIYHSLMNSIPKETKDGLRDTELLFRLTITQVLGVYENFSGKMGIDEFVSDAYIIFHSKYRVFDPSRGNWFSYCFYIRHTLATYLTQKFKPTPEVPSGLNLNVVVEIINTKDEESFYDRE